MLPLHFYLQIFRNKTTRTLRKSFHVIQHTSYDQSFNGGIIIAIDREIYDQSMPVRNGGLIILMSLI